MIWAACSVEAWGRRRTTAGIRGCRGRPAARMRKGGDAQEVWKVWRGVSCQRSLAAERLLRCPLATRLSPLSLLSPSPPSIIFLIQAPRHTLLHSAAPSLYPVYTLSHPPLLPLQPYNNTHQPLTRAPPHTLPVDCSTVATCASSTPSTPWGAGCSSNIRIVRSWQLASSSESLRLRLRPLTRAPLGTCGWGAVHTSVTDMSPHTSLVFVKTWTIHTQAALSDCTV